MVKDDIRITHDVIKMYEIELSQNSIYIYTPCSINIDNYKIKESDISYTISNKIISVTLWKNRKIMHVSVY